MRNGGDSFLPPDRETGAPRHTFVHVYLEMLLEICRAYPGLPDPRTLTIDEILFFYNGHRPYLREVTKPRA